jgi:hypothetical protein
VARSGIVIAKTAAKWLEYPRRKLASGKSVLTKAKNAESVDELSKMNNPEKVLVALKGSARCSSRS